MRNKPLKGLLPKEKKSPVKLKLADIKAFNKAMGKTDQKFYHGPSGGWSAKNR